METNPLRPLSQAMNWLFGSAAAQEEALADRLAAVARVRITPYKFVGYQNQSVTFSALATDALGNTVHGVKFTWESSDPQKADIDETGQVTFLQPGLATITCRAGLVTATAPVLVRSGAHPIQTDAQWAADQASLTVSGTTSSGSGAAAALLPSLLDQLAPSTFAQSCTSGGDPGDVAYNELWNDPRNLTGTPRNRAIEPTRLGPVLPEGSNFEFAAPLISLGGRGLAANLTLYYNSRVWSRHGNTITFNAINGWPYAGFSIGYGRIVTYGTDPSITYMLADPDGTRHFLGVAPSTGTNNLETNDGTHIGYTGNASSGSLYYPDGTKLSFVLMNNRLLPTQITDPNGNYIQIAYKTFFTWNQAIDYVTDTLGRVIQFNYDSCGNLTSITAPALGGTGTRTMAQFDYQARSLSFNFSGLTVENASSGQTINPLKHIYFPTTQTGYLLSYSDYGMVYNVSLRRQMSIDQNGVISDGTESASMNYNYPTLGSTSLSDAPAFTQRVESPGGTYSYSTSVDSVAQTQTFAIARPDASTFSLIRSTNSAAIANGLLVQSQIDASGVSPSLTKTMLNYAADGDGSPQVQSVTTYDDSGTPTKVDFDYNRKGAVTNRREYGQQHQLQLRRQWQPDRRRHTQLHV